MQNRDAKFFINHFKRNKILDQIGEGVLTPEQGEKAWRDDIRTNLQNAGFLDGKSIEQVEALIDNHGVTPLRPVVDPGRYDPMKKPDWSLLMAIAWIMHRDQNEVREFWDEFRTAQWEWFPVNVEIIRAAGQNERRTGFRLQQLKPSSFIQFIAGIAERGRPLEWYELRRNARDFAYQFHLALQEGTITAIGRDARTERIVSIPAFEWRMLEMFSLRTDSDSLVDQVTKNVPYTNVSVRRDEILAVWPITPVVGAASSGSASPLPEQRRRISSSKEQELPKLIEGYYARHPKATREQMWKGLEAEANFIIPQSVRREAAKKAPPRGKAGRKPGN